MHRIKQMLLVVERVVVAPEVKNSWLITTTAITQALPVLEHLLFARSRGWLFKEKVQKTALPIK